MDFRAISYRSFSRGSQAEAEQLGGNSAQAIDIPLLMKMFTKKEKQPESTINQSHLISSHLEAMPPALTQR